ncbi:MAG: SCO family protein [Verrucomicrobiae bacterium]|nr:SCO family protein [Verrucomicrobiae bacterium]
MPILLLAACEKGNERVFNQVRGVVQELPADDPLRVIIDHEEMPGYMNAMIMPFHVKEAGELEGLTPGAVITFDYHTSGSRSWIEYVTDTGEKGEIKSGDSDAAASPVAPLLKEGDLLPDYQFVDETGAGVKLSDFRGMPVALTFVFSRCPVPEYCPAMMRNFKSVLDRLEKTSGAPKRFHLLTISFDTWNDTPEVMAAWAAGYGHKAGQPWSLLTSDSCCTINQIGANVGLKFGEVKGSYQHNLRTVVLDSEGRIQHIFTDETWKTEELVAELIAADSVNGPDTGT